MNTEAELTLLKIELKHLKKNLNNFFEATKTQLEAIDKTIELLEK